MTATTRDAAPIELTDGELELRLQDIGGGMSVGYIRAPAGTDLGPALKGMPDDMCQCPHWGFVTKGRLRMRTKEGTEEYQAGDAYYWAPGHAPEALEDSEFMEFSPTEEFRKVLDHIKGDAG
ncbi:cupin domain-containing protein [Streptomyces decoyicus]|uniref:hypothetical protein n=1 Tax=Streptomyces decoyicus TaxID=249567 RepID=UPI0037FBDEEE